MQGAKCAVWRATRAIRNTAERPRPASQMSRSFWNEPSVAHRFVFDHAGRSASRAVVGLAERTAVQSPGLMIAGAWSWSCSWPGLAARPPSLRSAGRAPGRSDVCCGSRASVPRPPRGRRSACRSRRWAWRRAGRGLLHAVAGGRLVRPRQVRQMQQKVVDQAAPPVVSGHAGAAEAQLGARQRRDGHGLLPQALVHALFQPGLTAPQAVAGDVGVEQILQAHCDPPASGSDCGASFAERHKFVAGGQASQIEQEGLQRVGIGLEPERDLVGVLIARDPHLRRIDPEGLGQARGLAVAGGEDFGGGDRGLPVRKIAAKAYLF